MFQARAEQERCRAHPSRPRLGAGGRVNGFMFPGGMGGMGGGLLALNQLLVVMDGIDDPPWGKRFVTNRVNTLLDSSYIVPRTVGNASLRMPKP